MDLPDVMTAIEIASPGGPEVLVPATRPVPVPGEGELLVRVVAAGVNRPDVLQRRGFYPPPPGASDVPGLEIAGEVVAAGPGVTHLIGTKVCALVAGGGYSEYALAPAVTALPVPDGLPLHEAAGLPETLFTVWSNLFERGFAAEGDWALVHGGTSGIGTMAIALCRLFGVKVIVTCGSDDKCAAALGLGAAAAINYLTQDFVEVGLAGRLASKDAYRGLVERFYGFHRVWEPEAAAALADEAFFGPRAAPVAGHAGVLADRLTQRPRRRLGCGIRFGEDGVGLAFKLGRGRVQAVIDILDVGVCGTGIGHGGLLGFVEPVKPPTAPPVPASAPPSAIVIERPGLRTRLSRKRSYRHDLHRT